MQRTRISELDAIETAEIDVLIRGWIRTKRDSKALSFINLNDGSTMNGIQIIVDLDLPNYEDVKKLTTGASLQIIGKLVESPGHQKYEIQAKEIHIYGDADPETYPIQKKKMTLEYLREYAHLRPRTNTYSAVFRLRHAISFAVHKFFEERGF